MCSIGSCRRLAENQMKNYAKTIKDSLILDMGAGDGEHTTIFRCNNNHLVGIDIKYYVKPELKKFKFVQGDCTKLPFKTHIFDIVISFDVIEHVNDDSAFLREARRVLKRNGRLILGTPNRNRLSNRILKAIGKPVCYPLILGEGCVHLREYTLHELKLLLKEAGFSKYELYSYWFGLRLRKFDFGFEYTPHLFSDMAQYLFVEAKK